jgi:Mg-chelatase subunit ChlD
MARPEFPIERTWRASLLLAAAVVVVACGGNEGTPAGARRAGGSARGSTGQAAPAATGGAAQAGNAAPGWVLQMGTKPIRMQESCADTMVQAGRKQPLVMIVIDGSGSMCAPFGNATRWTALRSALMDPDGIVTKLQAAVSFGVTLYDGPLDLNGLLAGGGNNLGSSVMCADSDFEASMGKACPNLVEVPQALNNEPPIAAVYPMKELGGSTPTHKALAVVVDKLIETRVAVPDQVLQPQYIVLATDGEPNELCPNPTGVDPHAEVIAQVTRAAEADIKTFVISLAGDDANLMSHLVKVAEAGMTGFAPFSPMSKQDLVASLTQIIGGAVGCEVLLNGTVTQGQECAGTVDMNGAALPCNDPNGWSLKDDHTLILNGQACSDFQSNPLSVLRADFPCGVFNPS